MLCLTPMDFSEQDLRRSGHICPFRDYICTVACTDDGFGPIVLWIGLSRREKLGDFSGVLELLQVEQSIFQLLDTSTRQDAGSQQTEFF